MVNLEKKKVALRTKSKRGSGEKGKIREIETQVFDYGDSRVAGTDLVVSVGVATFNLKEEDRHQVLRLGEDQDFRACQKKLRCEPRMAAFVGVYDGHDGDMASDYCSKGLVPHILAELTSRSSPQTQRWSFAADRACAPLTFETPEDTTYCDMQIPYIAAFQKAQERFCNSLDPPSFDEVSSKTGGALKVAPATSYNPMQWMATPADPQRGGTTACTMSVFTELGEEVPQVVVANTGDSRLITDDATGGAQYRQVTTDHRPSDPAEKTRLTECVARGESYMHRSSEYRDVRVFPGGLAVSRTIGDGACSKSVICTPEVINVPLKIGLGGNKKGEGKTQRFVLASDGLWDAIENDVVGKAAARRPALKRRGSNDGTTSGSISPKRQLLEQRQTPKTTSPKEAAAKILQQCLEAGGNRDDITICVVDVSYIVE